MPVLAGNKARTGMGVLRTTRIRDQRVTGGRGPENRAPWARIARLTQIGGHRACGIPVHPGSFPTQKGVDCHLQTAPRGASRLPATQGGEGEGPQGHQHDTWPGHLAPRPPPAELARQSTAPVRCCVVRSGWALPLWTRPATTLAACKQLYS